MTTLLVASSGGHLQQLHHIHRRLPGVDGPFHWVTFDTSQSRSLLADVPRLFVPFVGGRDPIQVARNLPYARRILREFRPDTMVSTGSAVALPYFALGAAKGVRCIYIESAARAEGPSMTGGLIARLPGVELYTQHPQWQSDKWAFGGSVFDVFESEPDREIEFPQIKRVVVTLGTYRGFGFRRLLERMIKLLPPTAEVLWQTGDTDPSGLGINAHEAIPSRELAVAMREADVVVAHAGVGSALAAFEAGKCPVLVPRRLEQNEHIDDHQVQIATALSESGLAVSPSVEHLDEASLVAAASRRIVVRENGGEFRLRAPASAAARASRAAARQ